MVVSVPATLTGPTDRRPDHNPDVQVADNVLTLEVVFLHLSSSIGVRTHLAICGFVYEFEQHPELWPSCGPVTYSVADRNFGAVYVDFMKHVARTVSKQPREPN